MWGAWIRLIIYMGIIIMPVVTATVFGHGFGNTAREIGKCLALSGFIILALQFFLASRIKWVERPFGLDILIRFHKHMAIFAVCLLLAHPLLMAAGDAQWKLIFGLDLPWYIWLGKISLAVLIINFVLSVWQSPLKLKFERWRFIHNASGLLILTFTFTHSWFAGDDIQLIFMRWIWVWALVLTGLMYLYHRIIRPRRLKRRPYAVSQVHSETKNVWTIKLTPPEGEKISAYNPGQFHFITFYRNRNLPVEEHHWTISSSPEEKGYVSSTIKALGDFTSTIGETKTGDKASIHGPFGRFSYALHPEERDLVFIAGGIGITPLMSMLRHMRDTKEDISVLLLYANPEEDQIVFQEELAAIEKGQHPLLKVVHILSRPGYGWTGEKGYVDKEKIDRFCARNLDGKVFYICGPPAMSKSLVKILRSLSVPDKHIRLEIFSLVD